MRRGTWILALCGIAGLALSAGAAANGTGGLRRVPSQAGGMRPSLAERAGAPGDESAGADSLAQAGRQQAPSRYTRRPETVGERRPASAAAPGAPVKNYYRELFGSDEGAPAEADRSLPGAAVPAAGAGPSAQSRPSPQSPRSATSGGGVVQAVGAEESAAPSRIIQADHRRLPGEKERDRIELIRAETPEPPRGPSVTETRGPGAVRGPQSESRIAVASDLFKAGSSDAQVPAVTLRWVRQGSINVGQECVCDLVVSNTGPVPARNVTVEAHFPGSVRLTSAQPRPAVEADYLSWTFPTLNAGQEQVIKIKMIPSQRGEMATTAFVRFTGSASSAFEVEEPMLKVAVKGPQEVMLGDPASQIVEVTNPGTGVAENVVVEAILPAGLEHPRGERLAMSVGSLSPGETRSVRLALAAAQGGQHIVQIEARADANLRQQASAPITVIAPSLQVAVDGPGLRYIGRHAPYEVTVTNDGTAVSNNVRVTHRVPDGFDFVRADRGGKHEPGKRTVEWFLGRLEPGQSARVKVELTPTKLGKHVHQAVAVSEHGAASESTIETEVDGTASLVVDIVDLNDPVEVGVETAYEVRLRNDGSKAATNVGISCELPAGVEFLNAQGPVDHLTEKNLVVFRSLKALAPGETALYRVHVRGVQEGNHRFRARLASDSIQEPLVFEELTKFYAE